MTIAVRIRTRRDLGRIIEATLRGEGALRPGAAPVALLLFDPRRPD